MPAGFKRKANPPGGLAYLRRVKMKKKMIMAVMAAVFLNVSGAYAETMFSFGGAMFFHGDGGVGWNGFVPQVGYMSVKKKIERKITGWITTPNLQIPRYSVRPIGWDFDGFEYSILFDITFGLGFAPDMLNLSSGLTAEFYFLTLPLIGLGAGIGGGWGLIGFDWLLREEDMQYPYGAPCARVTIPIVVGTFKTGVYFDYYFMDKPYTQFNIVCALTL
jgi:hypothetical protein